jgi:hypothetical protein
MGIVVSEVVHNTGGARVHVSAAELLCRDHLPRRGLHQGWSTEEDRPLATHDHRLVAHGWHICATRRAGAQHSRDLRDTHG